MIRIKERFVVLNAIKIEDFPTQNPATTSTTTEITATTSEQPDDCMPSNFKDLENNLSKMFTESLKPNWTEHQKKSHAESCTEVNYQTLYFIKNDVQHSAILSEI